MNQSVVIRKPDRSEIPQLAELGSRLFQQTFDGLYTEQDLQAFLTQVHSPAGVAYDWDAGCTFWIAEAVGQGSAVGSEPNQLVGYCKAGPVKVPLEVGNRRALELRQLYIEKSYFRCGIGSKFMHKFFVLCDELNIQDAFVSCWSENERALAFYASFGFKEVGKYEFLVGNHRDHELILCKQL